MNGKHNGPVACGGPGAAGLAAASNPSGRGLANPVRAASWAAREPDRADYGGQIRRLLRAQEGE
jgi:hypothetical protein